MTHSILTCDLKQVSVLTTHIIFLAVVRTFVAYEYYCGFCIGDLRKAIVLSRKIGLPKICN